MSFENGTRKRTGKRAEKGTGKRDGKKTRRLRRGHKRLEGIRLAGELVGGIEMKIAKIEWNRFVWDTQTLDFKK